MAVVAEGDRGRIYLPPTPEQERRADRRRAELEARRRDPITTRGLHAAIYGLRVR